MAENNETNKENVEASVQDSVETGIPEDITQDENIDVAALIRTAKAEQKADTEQAEEDSNSASVSRPLSPLEQMQLEEQNRPKGFKISTEKLLSSMTDGSVKPMINRFDEDMQKRLEESDALQEKREHAVIIKRATTQEDLIKAVDELDALKHDETTDTWYFDLKDAKGQPVEPVYFRVRTAEDGEFDYNTEAANVGVEPTNNNSATSEAQDSAETSEDKSDKEEDEKKKKLVEIIIDKSQQGQVEFTDQEKKDIIEASELRLKEVQTLEIPSKKIRRSDVPMSFHATVQKYNIARGSVRVYFPCSGFSADMTPLTYGEMNDIAFDMESLTQDKFQKRMSVIYNHMTNISIGSFDNFDDFMKTFAYFDVEVALWGLYCATYPEVQSIEMNCGNCQKHFTMSFATRSLINLQACSVTYLEKYKRLVEASPAMYDEVRAKSPVMNTKAIEMPKSKFVFGVGIASAWDFLYNVIPMLNEEEFKKIFPDDANNTRQELSGLLFGLRFVQAPLENGEYTDMFTSYTDLLDALYMLNPDEISILGEILNRFTEEYMPVFTLKNAVCSHCKTETESITVDMGTLVFMTLQRLKSIGINADITLD